MSKISKKHIEAYFDHNYGGSWWGDFNNFLKKHHVISRGLSLASPFLGSYALPAEMLAGFASNYGYGSGRMNYKKKDLEKYASHKLGSGWFDTIKNWASKAYHGVKDHLNKHGEKYKGFLRDTNALEISAKYLTGEKKGLNNFLQDTRLTSKGISHLNSHSNLPQSVKREIDKIAEAVDVVGGYGMGMAKTKRAIAKRKKNITTPLRQYGSGFNLVP